MLSYLLTNSALSDRMIVTHCTKDLFDIIKCNTDALIVSTCCDLSVPYVILF